MEAGFYKVHPDLHQVQTRPLDYPVGMWGGTALKLHMISAGINRIPHYLNTNGVPTYDALRRAAKVADGSVFDDILMHYTNPLTGGAVMPTIGASMQLLRPGFVGKAHRHTGSFIYQVAKVPRLFSD